MKNLFVIAVIAGVFVFSVPLLAQNRRNGGGVGQGNGRNAPSKAERDKWRKDREGRGDREGGDWLKKRIAELGWGESGDEERIEPGDTVDEDDKDERLEAEAAKLGLEDKKVIKDFVKYAKRAWIKAERKDGRLALDYKKHQDDAEKWTEDLNDHKEDLAEIWADCDEDLEDKEIIASDVLEEFRKNTKDLRETTATMKSAEQDKIRQRKIEEIKKQAEEWANRNKGSNAAGGDKDNEVKKEKKEEE